MFSEPIPLLFTQIWSLELLLMEFEKPQTRLKEVLWAWNWEENVDSFFLLLCLAWNFWSGKIGSLQNVKMTLILWKRKGGGWRNEAHLLMRICWWYLQTSSGNFHSLSVYIFIFALSVPMISSLFHVKNDLSLFHQGVSDFRHVWHEAQTVFHGSLHCVA